MQYKMNKIKEGVWEIPKSEKEGMLVPARVLGTHKLIKEMDDGVFNQVTNVACFTGIQKYALCMPDGHWGYGFPIGGVAAFELEKGVISPGGIGFDINCGMRLGKTNLKLEEVEPKPPQLMDKIFYLVPSGGGCEGFVKINH